MTMEQFPPPSDDPDPGAEGSGVAPDTEEVGYFVSGVAPDTEEVGYFVSDVDLDAARGGSPEREDDPQLETRF